MILKSPDPKLSKVCSGFGSFSEAKQLEKRLTSEYKRATMDYPKVIVVGLAAPQIGVTKNMFVAFEAQVFINPKIVWHGHKKTEWREGCLSLPDDMVITTERWDHIILSWMDESRKMFRESFQGSLACVVQHEMDHLSGIIIGND